MQAGDIEEDEDNNEGEEHGWKEPEVLCGFIEDWRLLENGKAARAGCEQIEPLHDDEVDEVDRGGFIEDL